MVKAGLGVSFNQAMIARDWKEEVVQVPLSPKHFVSLGIALPKKKKLPQLSNDLWIALIIG